MDLKAIIIEDELNSRATLYNMLTNFCEGVDVVAQAGTINEGVEFIIHHKPNLVFLDIELPSENGFKLFDYFEEPDFEIIFTTAYDQYALKAFKRSAIDYLLKPIDLEELRNALEKAKKKKHNEQSLIQYKILRENLNNILRRLALPTMDGLIFVDLDEIIHCEAQGNYTIFHLVGDEKVMVSKTLKIYSELLEDFNFFRINRSHLINLNKVRKFGRQKSPSVTLVNGTILPLSEARRKEFLEKLENTP